MSFHTTDLCDEFDALVQVVEPRFRSFGGHACFAGPMSTVRVLEDNVLVRAQLETRAEGRVLVVDGGGSLRCALLGDRMAALAQANGWAGVVINGCVRDSEAIAATPIGVRALNTHPRRSGKAGQGKVGVDVRFAGVLFRPGDYLYADMDGIVVAPRDLLAR